MKYTVFETKQKDVIMIVHIEGGTIGFKWQYSSISDTFETDPRVSADFKDIVRHRRLFEDYHKLIKPDDVCKLFEMDRVADYVTFEPIMEEYYKRIHNLEKYILP